MSPSNADLLGFAPDIEAAANRSNITAALRVGGLFPTPAAALEWALTNGTHPAIMPSNLSRCRMVATLAIVEVNRTWRQTGTTIGRWRRSAHGRGRFAVVSPYRTWKWFTSREAMDQWLRNQGAYFTPTDIEAAIRWHHAIHLDRLLDAFADLHPFGYRPKYKHGMKRKAAAKRLLAMVRPLSEILKEWRDGLS
jgi:hypothetical protein